ncbi:AbrB/MazE/SpoVT family DNA-binding domain-containing protein [Corticibacterium sp. UT-5YL-CI-8]|nr:AbrB/MazE/SpoVT family DNA-binding domain-containing protein [Tianweitania sp. UT-5YL-CI-8]
MNVRTTMSSKGQIVVPKPLRDAHGWTAGTEFDFIETEEGVIMQPVSVHEADLHPLAVDEFLGMIPKVSGPRLTDEEIGRLVLAEASRRFDASGN